MKRPIGRYEEIPGVRIEPDRERGGYLAAYLSLGYGPVARTAQLAKGSVLVDYDSKGNVIGVEVLGPFQRPEEVPPGRKIKP